MQARGYEDAAKEVLPEEAVTKEVADKTENSTAHHTHNLSETEMEKLWVLDKS